MLGLGGVLAVLALPASSWKGTSKRQLFFVHTTKGSILLRLPGSRINNSHNLRAETYLCQLFKDRHINFEFP